MPRELNVAHKKKIVRSIKSKLLSEFSQFLPCGENNNRQIELLLEVIKNEREEVLEMLICDGVVLSREGEISCLLTSKKKHMINYII